MKCLECEKPESEWTDHEGAPCCSVECLDVMGDAAMVQCVRDAMAVSYGHSVSIGAMMRTIGDIASGPMIWVNDHNIVYGIGMSSAMIKALTTMRDAREIVMYPSSMLAILIDGGPIPSRMPLVKRPPKNGYKKEHYCPVVFYEADLYDKLVRQGRLSAGA